MFKNTITFVSAIFFFIHSGKAHEISWRAGFLGFFDNREYFNKYVAPQTMFGARSFTNVGLVINDYQEIALGVDFLYEFGGEIHAENLKPILYFKHVKDPIEFYVGAFPRIDHIKMPRVLLSDTLLYYRPNVEGIFLQFRKSWGYQNIWLDWTSRQTDTKRETFIIGGSGGLRLGSFFYRHNFMMYHHAGPGIPIPNDNLRDNGGLNAIVGLDLSSKSVLDTFVLSTGFTMSYDRIRTVYELRYCIGSSSELNVQYKGLGIYNTLYAGPGQTILFGDGLYKAEFYNRLDFYWNIFNKHNIKGRVEFSVHFLPETVNYSQRLVLYMNITGRKSLKSIY